MAGGSRVLIRISWGSVQRGVLTGLCFVSYVSVGQLGKDSGLVEEVEELTMNINTNPSELRIPLTFPTAGLPSPQVVPSLSDFPFR